MQISRHLSNWLRPHALMLLYVLIFVGCTVSQGTVGPGQAPSLDPEESMAPEMTLETGIERLARGILESLSSDERLKIAVVDLLGPNDSHTEFGSFVSEKLITKLFVSGRFEKVLKRRLLRHLLVQQRIEMEGYFDQDTVGSICQKIGVDAMVMGFVTDMGSRVDVNLRLIDTRGEILSVAEAQIGKDRVVGGMLRGTKRAGLMVATDPSHVEASVAVGEQVVRSVDGIALFRGVPQGNRSVVVTARGYETVQQSIYLTDERSITVGLIPKRATLTLRIDPSDGEIVFDGENKGRASQGVMVLSEMLPGKHTVRVSAEGYLPQTRGIEVYEDKVISVKLPPDPLTKIANLKQDKPSFNIEIWTDKKRYRIGEEIRFQFRSDQDCYLTLIDYETNGSVKVLFPNRYFQNSLIEAGKTYTIPGNEYGFKLIIEPPTGIEKVRAIATTKPLSFFEMDFTEDIFPRVERSNTRSMRGIRVAMESLPHMNWAEDTCTISIR